MQEWVSFTDFCNLANKWEIRPTFKHKNVEKSFLSGNTCHNKKYVRRINRLSTQAQGSKSCCRVWYFGTMLTWLWLSAPKRIRFETKMPPNAPITYPTPQYYSTNKTQSLCPRVCYWQLVIYEEDLWLCLLCWQDNQADGIFITIPPAFQFSAPVQGMIWYNKSNSHRINNSRI